MKNEINWEQKAVDAIDAVAAKIGAGANHFYPILVKQQVIEGLQSLALALILFSIAGVLIFVGFKNAKKFKSEKIRPHDLTSPRATFINTMLISSIVFIIIGCQHVHLTMILNPEYHALKDILGMFK